MENKQLTPSQQLEGTLRAGKMLEKLRSVMPAHINEDAFIVSAVKYCTSNPKVMQANRNSILYAIFDAAKAGVLLDGQQAFINTYSGQATMQTMYKGNAKRAGLVQYGAILVHEGDAYEASMGIDGAEFKYSMARKDRGPLQLVVGWAIDSSGFKRILELPAERVEAIKKRELGKRSSSPWKSDSDEMMKKHVINVMCKNVVEPTVDAPLVLESVDQETGEIEEINITPKPKDTTLTAAQIAVQSTLNQEQTS